MHCTLGKPSLTYAGLICISAVLLTKGDNVTTEVEITEHPQNVSTFIGMPATLMCRFSSAVNCHWTHNGNTVHLHNLGEDIMMLHSDGRNTTDCSIIITSVQASSHGTWNCIGSMNAANQNISANEAWISTQQFIKMVGGIHNATTEEDMPVMLPCKFNRPVTCLWRFGLGISSLASKLGIHYSYTKYQLTKDCSLNISKALLMYNGAYECTGSLKNENFKHTATIWLTVLQAKASEEGISEQPMNTSQFFGNKVVLQCKFLFDVTCVWDRIYSPDVGSRSMIVYSNSMITKTCKYTIYKFTILDVGTYRCTGQDVNQTRWYSTDAWLTLKDTQEIVVVQHPESVNATLGSSIVLTCKFSDLVDCAWERNGKMLFTSFYMLTYINSGGEDTRDCSIRIRSFTIALSGNYVCKRKYANNNETSSKVAWVALTNYFIQVEKEPPVAARFKLGQQVILECTFNATTDCQWTRNRISFYPSFHHSKYSYSNSSGKNTTDCTLQIKAFNVTDAGTYKCTSSNAHHITAMSQNSEITADGLIASIGVTDNPKNVTVNCGEDIILDCGFNISVYCSWTQLNGTTILSTDNSPHYQFLNRSNPKMNCSMQISSVQLVDAGLWVCKGTFNNVSQMSTSAAHLTVKDIQVERNKTKTKLAFIYSYYENTFLGLVQLKCKFNMTPAICYWTYRANSLSKDFKLLKLFTKVADCSFSQRIISSGLYQCQAVSNDTNEILSSPELIVYIPSPLEDTSYVNQLAVGPMNTTVKFGQMVTLACKFQKPIKCIWLLGSEIRYSQTIRSKRYRVPHHSAAHLDCSLTIISVRKSDIGHWTCQGQHTTFFSTASITPTDISDDAWINEQKMPEDPEMISEMGIVTNMTINNTDLKEDFHCISKHGNPSANLRWSLNGELVNGIEEITTVDEFLYTTKLFWDPDIRVKTNDTLLCIADHIEYDSVKFAKVAIVVPITDMQKQQDLLSTPNIILKNATISSGHWVNQSVSLDNLHAILCCVKARDAKQALFWEYAGKRYSGIREDRQTENGTIEIWLQWNDTIPVRDNLTNLACITELIITPQRASIQIQNPASVVPPGTTNKLAVTLICITIALGLIAVIGYTIYRFKARKTLDGLVFLKEQDSLMSRGSDDL